MDIALYRVVVRQGGVFTTAHARESHSDVEIARLVRTGRWRRTRWRGVLVDAELPDTPALLVRAAALVVGADLVACHSTAALLHGFDVLGGQVLHFLGPACVPNRSRPGIRVHPSSLGTDDAVLVDGVWCTPPARTACDVVRLTAPIDGLATLDAALRSGWCTRDDLAAATEEHRGLRQVTRLRTLVPHADPGAESPMESRMRWRYLEGGLPAPETQLRVGDGGEWRELDVGWREYRVGSEFDGLEAHMTRQQLADDRHRHNWLTARGWTLLHVTAVDVYRHPDRMLADATRAIALSR
ncbi:hypothetical protein GB931_20775 [Modestobacter sp. I12A-02628]|uniref:DUF559 domain-containing protein n=1 Tax=Goekera deserti TaxID=2497753 RepID=A0A7K3W8H6_9ACTN|nr:hypothetical protein [Goekera deserti]MPR00308.1 hypothetical protein [Goekera deserti]NDI49482.1 hypothetical protein [Goekera deserti]NEL52644.1 hypothetical protein [Goekera deserti]